MKLARSAVGAALRLAPGLAPAAKRTYWRLVYDLSSRGRGAAEAPFMNYGYAAPDDELPQDADYFGGQLYARVAGAAELAGKDVLDIGCGRGGGTAFVFERFRPRTMTGLDLAPAAIRRARADHGRPGLTFVAGDAEELPFPASTFDVVLNVESSHCYPSVPRFLAEVYRVLRPGGLLLLADFRHSVPPDETHAAVFEQEDVACLREQITAAELRPVDEEDLTAGILRALRLDTPNRRARLQQRMPRLLRRQALAFAGVEDGPVYRAYEQGLWTYLRFVLQKP